MRSRRRRRRRKGKRRNKNKTNVGESLSKKKPTTAITRPADRLGRWIAAPTSDTERRAMRSGGNEGGERRRGAKKKTIVSEPMSNKKPIIAITHPAGREGIWIASPTWNLMYAVWKPERANLLLVHIHSYLCSITAKAKMDFDASL